MVFSPFGDGGNVTTPFPSQEMRPTGGRYCRNKGDERTSGKNEQDDPTERSRLGSRHEVISRTEIMALVDFVRNLMLAKRYVANIPIQYAQDNTQMGYSKSSKKRTSRVGTNQPQRGGDLPGMTTDKATKYCFTVYLHSRCHIFGPEPRQHLVPSQWSPIC